MIPLSLSPISSPNFSSFPTAILSPIQPNSLLLGSSISSLPHSNLISPKSRQLQPKTIKSRTNTIRVRNPTKYPSLKLPDEDKKPQKKDLSFNLDRIELNKPGTLSPLNLGSPVGDDIGRVVRTEAAVPGYLQPTFAAITRRSFRVTDNNEKNFQFAMGQKTSYEYNSPSSVSSSEDSKSPKSGQQGKQQRGSFSRFDASTRNNRDSQRKSVFFTQMIKKISDQERIQVPATRGYPIIDEVITDKAEQKRVSAIMTKELEARYGVRILSSESKESSDSEHERSEEEREGPKTDRPRVQVYEPAIRSQTVEGSHSFTLEDQELSKSNMIDSDTESDIYKGERRPKREFSLQTMKESDIFASKPGSFFQFNQTNKFLQEMGRSLTNLDYLPGSKTEEQLTEPSQKEGFSRREKAIITRIGSHNQIVQPEFMKTLGSMCITEFWSKKYNNVFSKMMKDKTNFVKVYNEAREDELLYRPKRWKEEDQVKWRINRRDYMLDTPRNAKENKKERKISPVEGKGSTLPLIKQDSIIPLTTVKSQQESGASNGNTFQRTWQMKTMTKIVKREPGAKKSETKRDAEKGKNPPKKPKNVTARSNLLGEGKKSKPDANKCLF